MHPNVAWIKSSLFFTAEWLSMVSMCHSCTHLPVGRYLGYFHFLTIMNRTAINIRVHFTSLGQIPQNGNARSQGKWIFNSMRNYQTVYQNGYIILHSQQQCPENYSCSIPSPRLGLICLFNASHSCGCHHCGSNLHFPNESWFWVSSDVFQIRISHKGLGLRVNRELLEINNKWTNHPMKMSKGLEQTLHKR